MSHDDLLDRAVRAAKEFGDSAATEADTSRNVILAAAVEQHQRRRRTATIVMPVLATLLIAQSALAAATGSLAPTAWWHAVVNAMPMQRIAARSAPRQATALARQDPNPRAAPKPLPTASPATDLNSVVPTSTVSNPVPLPVAKPRYVPPDVPPDADGALYATAHGAHFVHRDPAAALRAWDTYLRAMPHGRYVIE